jgi:hypothetical protein
MLMTVLRWTARGASVAIAIAFVLFWWDSPPRLPELSTGIRWQLALMTSGVAGLLLGLWRPWAGGMVAATGFLGFLLLEGLHLHRFPYIPAVYVMLLPALLYLLVGVRRPVPTS